MSADDWDAVFALAEGGDATSFANNKAPKRGIEREATRTREDKNRRRTKKRKSSAAAAAAIATTQKQYLLDRCNSEANTNGIHDSTGSGAAAGTAVSLLHSFVQRAPSGKQPKNSSDAGKSKSNAGEQWYCAEWKKARSDDNNSTSGSSSTLRKELCDCCRLPSGGHVMMCTLDAPSSSNRNANAKRNGVTATTVLDDTHVMLLCNVYTSIRNLRCWCRCQLELRDQQGDCGDGMHASSMLSQAAESTSRRIGICMDSTQFWIHLSDSLESIRLRSRDELWLEPISTKGRDLLNHQAKLTKTATTAAALNKSTLSWACFEGLVQCIMACDAVYYQLYYAQLTVDAGDCTQPAFWIPHPISYFGEWEQNVHDAAGGITTEQNIRDNALVTLHRLCQAETTAIFDSWMTLYPHVPASLGTWHNVAKVQQDDDAYSAFTAQHATLAPPLLAAWRDSCRDFVCHLYSYATISNDTLRSVLDTISTKNGHGIRHILEVGAGTGYLAHLLTKIATETVAASSRTTAAAVSIVATDAVPDASNEYHAATPAFVDTVHRGDSTRAKFWKQPFVTRLHTGLYGNSNGKQQRGLSQTALLLCYPPPQSNMAIQTIRHFWDQMGRIVIHIGEFQGLTGSAELEQCLISECVRLDACTWPCLSWGTDAAHVSIWEKRTTTTSVKSHSLLLPCVQCRTLEATRRCRLLRTIHYCGRSCHDAHAEERTKALARVMVDISALPEQLDLENPLHYSKLRDLD